MAEIRKPQLAEGLEAWARYASPGPEHGVLEGLIGSWEGTARFRVAPDQPFHSGRVSSVNQWVLGGRFVQLSLEGEALGERFSGLGYVGFDRLEERYVFVWLETATTMMETRSGEVAEAGQVLVLWGKHRDPASREVKATKLIFRFATRDSYRVEISEQRPDGGEFAFFEAEYGRGAAGGGGKRPAVL